MEQLGQECPSYMQHYTVSNDFNDLSIISDIDAAMSEWATGDFMGHVQLYRRDVADFLGLGILHFRCRELNNFMRFRRTIAGEMSAREAKICARCEIAPCEHDPPCDWAIVRTRGSTTLASGSSLSHRRP